MQGGRGRESPKVTGLSPKEGPPGTKLTIRGENLGFNEKDLFSVTVCGVNVTLLSEWISPSKIVCCTTNCKGPGDVIVTTKSGGIGSSTIKFRGLEFLPNAFPDSAIWVSESSLFERRLNSIGRPSSHLPEGRENPLGLPVEHAPNFMAPDELSDLEIVNLAARIGPSYYERLGVHLGFLLAQLEQIEVKYLQDKTKALMTILRRWRDNQQNASDTKEILADILCKSELKAQSAALLEGSLHLKGTSQLHLEKREISTQTMVRNERESQTAMLVEDYCLFWLRKQGIELQQYEDVNRKPCSPAAARMREIGEEMQRNTPDVLSSFSDQINMRETAAFDKFQAVVNELFSENNGEGAVSWRKIVTLITFSGQVAVHSARNDQEELVPTIIEWTAGYIESNLWNWIQDHQGWDGFVNFFHCGRSENYLHDCVGRRTAYGYAVLAAGFGALATCMLLL